MVGSDAKARKRPLPCMEKGPLTCFCVTANFCRLPDQWYFSRFGGLPTVAVAAQLTRSVAETYPAQTFAFDLTKVALPRDTSP